MPRKSIAPWSERVNEGLIDQPIDSEILASQDLRPIVNTGLIDQTGTWKGNVSSDTTFIAMQTDIGVANGAQILTPSVNADGSWPLDMTGYNDVILAIKTNDAGNYETTAVMGTGSFANLNPVNEASTLRGTINDAGAPAFSNILLDGADSLTANVWNIFYIGDRCRGQKLLQFKIVNNSGGIANIETAFMRLV